MKKKLKIMIWILVIWTLLVNIISLSNRIIFIDNEKSEILKERFDLPNHSRVLIAIIPKTFFRPYFKMVYLDDIIRTMDTGKIGEAGDTAFSILPDMIEEDILQYIWIFNIINIAMLIICISVYKIKYNKNN